MISEQQLNKEQGLRIIRACFRDIIAGAENLPAFIPRSEDVDIELEEQKILGHDEIRKLEDMRKQYASQMDATLFRHDIRVTVHGSGNRTLRLTGPIFIRNANIADTQSTLLEPAQKLRFSKIEYRWSPRFTETTYYDLDTPADSKVGS